MLHFVPPSKVGLIKKPPTEPNSAEGLASNKNRSDDQTKTPVVDHQKLATPLAVVSFNGSILSFFRQIVKRQFTAAATRF
jgi:hypothetical protein